MTAKIPRDVTDAQTAAGGRIVVVGQDIFLERAGELLVPSPGFGEDGRGVVTGIKVDRAKQVVVRHGITVWGGHGTPEANLGFIKLAGVLQDYAQIIPTDL